MRALPLRLTTTALTLSSLCFWSALQPALSADLGNLSEQERSAFRQEVRDYLLENPEILLEAMEVLQSREEATAANRDVQMLKDNQAAIFQNSGDWAGGNLDGDITIVEFMDYRCGYCHKAYQEVEELIKSDGNIRFVLKEFPVLGEQSVLASKFAISILQLHGPDAYKAAHDAMFSARGEMNEATLTQIAGNLGYKMADITTKMADASVQAVLDENYRLANLMEINGTPSFVIDQAMVRGYVPLDAMRGIVSRQREN